MRSRSVVWSLVIVLAAGIARAAEPTVLEAVKSADLAALRAELQRRADVNAAGPDGTTPLHWAVHLNNVEAADLLLKAGAKPAVPNRYGVTPLLVAATNANARMIALLIGAGADPNAASPEGETPLMLAARAGVPEAVAALVAHGASVNAKESWRGQTALMWAAAEGQAAVAKLLVETGADVSLRSKGGLTALLFAVRDGRVDAVRALIDGRANVNDAAPDGTSALGMAVINAHYELAALLLDRGANPNIADPRGTVLHALAWMRNPGYAAAPPRAQTGNLDSLELARRLLEKGASPNVRISWKEIRFDRDAGVVKPPPNISVGRNYMSFIGATPFYLAAKGADVALMRLLVEHGADPKTPTVQNVTPLMAAAGLGFWDGESPGPESGVPESQSLEAVKLAVELGNDVNAKTDFGGIEIEGDPIVLLKRHPLNLGRFPETALGDMRWGGSTAMHGAAVRGANSIIEYLVSKGADPAAKNDLGWTPLMVAQGVFVANTDKGWPSTVELLTRLTADRPAADARQR
jgi:ankyrin repeat protein